MTGEVSTDKKNWQTTQQALDLIVPEKTVEQYQEPIPAPFSPVNPNNSPDHQADNVISMPEVPNHTSCAKLKTGDLLLVVTASLGNGAGYLKYLNQYSSNTILAAGVATALFSICLGLLGGFLFCGCYNVSRTSFCIRSVLAILFSGVIFWLCNTLIRLAADNMHKEKSAETDFLCAMHGMMNISVISICLNAVLFVFNRDLFNMTFTQISTVTAAGLLPLIFFSGNIILSLRINFMGNCNLRSGWASLLAMLEFYFVTVAIALLLYLLY